MGSPDHGRCASGRPMHQNAEGNAISFPALHGRNRKATRRSYSLGRKRMDTVQRHETVRPRVKTANGPEPEKTPFMGPPVTAAIVLLIRG